MVSGIYLIINKINGHMYVGGSVNIEKRFNEHKHFKDLKHSAIDKAIKKYGADNFTYQIITELPADWKIIEEHEKYWIKFYNTFKDRKHYNLTIGGDSLGAGENHPMYNKKHSDETRKKISESNKGKTFSDEHKKNLSESHKGKYVGDNNPLWKDYARVTKLGFNRGKQQYGIKYNSKYLKKSIHLHKLYKWWGENYPNELLYLEI